MNNERIRTTSPLSRAFTPEALARIKEAQDRARATSALYVAHFVGLDWRDGRVVLLTPKVAADPTAPAGPGGSDR